MGGNYIDSFPLSDVIHNTMPRRQKVNTTLLNIGFSSFSESLHVQQGQINTYFIVAYICLIASYVQSMATTEKHIWD